MIRRCFDPRHSQFYNYGDRGITVDPEWLWIENFVRDMGHPPKGCTLDRIDNEDHYYKENCRWADAKQQAENRRTSRFISDGEETRCVKVLARKHGIKYETLLMRIKRGYPKETWFYRGNLKDRP